jgi:hypothetical protein
MSLQTASVGHSPLPPAKLPPLAFKAEIMLRASLRLPYARLCAARDSPAPPSQPNRKTQKAVSALETANGHQLCPCTSFSNSRLSRSKPTNLEVAVPNFSLGTATPTALHPPPPAPSRSDCGTYLSPLALTVGCSRT